MPFAIKNTVKKNAKRTTTTGSIKGVDEKTLLQLLDVASSTECINYICKEPGKLERRRGSKTLISGTEVKTKSIATCEPSETWTSNSWEANVGTVGNDVTNYKKGIGAKSCSTAVNGGGIKYDFTDLNFTAYKDSTVSTTADIIHFDIYITTAEIAKMSDDAKILVRFFYDTTPTITNHFEYGILKEDLSNGWNTFNIAKSSFTSFGSPSWATIAGMDTIYYSPTTAPSSAMSWTIDNVYMCQATGDANTPTVVYFKYTDKYHLVGYGTTLAAYDKDNKTLTVIKDDFTTDLEDGVRYGANAFTCNGIGEKICRISQILPYKAQSGNFTVGLTITGATSGATATVIADADSGTNGYLTITDIVGDFVSGEVITDISTGSATTNEAATFYIEELSNAPYCKRITIYENRLLAGNICRGTKSSSAKIIASQEDTDGTYPYFTNWSTGSAPTLGFELTYARAGEVKDMLVFDKTDNDLPEQLLVLHKDGYASYYRTIQNDGAGNMVQDVRKKFTQLNAGGEREATSTPYGIFYGNENGIFMIAKDGSTLNLTDQLNIEAINFDPSNSSFVFLPEPQLLFVTTRRNSTVNNIVYWFNLLTLGTGKVAWGVLQGWSISRFLLDGDTLYGSSDTKPKVLELLPKNIYDDDGSDVYYSYKQPMNVGSLETLKDATRIDIAGYLTSGSPVTVSFDVISETGQIIKDVQTFSWDTDGSGAVIQGYGEAEYGGSGYSGSGALGGTSWTPASYPLHIFGYMTYILKIKGNDTSPHIVSFVLLETNEYRQQRANLLTKN